MEDQEFEFEKEKKRIKIKYIIATIIVAIIVAVASSEFTLYYYGSSLGALKKEASQDSDENIERLCKWTWRRIFSIYDYK